MPGLFTDLKISQAVTFLEQFVKKQQPKKIKKLPPSEDKLREERQKIQPIGEETKVDILV